MHGVVAREALDQPQDCGDDALASAAIDAAGDDQSDVHAVLFGE
jgi:hypothetical protein